MDNLRSVAKRIITSVKQPINQSFC